jgi:TonB family protein
VFQVRPKYPKEAKDAGIEGKVVLQCIVKEDGSVGEIFVIEGKEPFMQAAKTAVAHWKYKPVMLNGVAVQSDTIVTVVFEILKEKLKANSRG